MELKTCYNTLVFGAFFWKFQGNAYLCNVFFIVLDLRLTKDWLSGKIAFFFALLPGLFYYLCVRKKRNV
ncbi:uncharacterized protein BN750_01531 [Bacteroides sp. CAG:661]|nr:uncharacterized protein BN750_01531 [Bacteroides sp. CAG:661]